MPVERHRPCGDQEETIRLLQAEVTRLQTRVTGLVQMVAAQQEAAPQIRADGVAEGYEQAVREGHAQAGRHRRPPPGRWLRAVPAIAVLAARPARHKLLAGLAASAALVVVAAPAMNLAPWIAGTPPSHRAPAVVKAFTPHPGKGGGGIAVPPPGRGKPSSPPGRGKPGPSPAATPAPAATATGTPSPDPSAAGTDTPTASPAATDTPDPDPSATATACPAPGKHPHALPGRGMMATDLSRDHSGRPATFAE